MARARRRVPARRLHLAPLGVDLDLFRPDAQQAARAENRIVHVGALTPVKDQALLLWAFAELKRDGAGATLEIVGNGPLRPELERLAERLAVTHSVCFRGAVDHAELPRVYRGASACVVSSRHEAQCMVALEAAACDVPLVGTRVGVIPELSRSVAPIGSPVALAQELSAVLDDVGAESARAVVQRKFSLERSAERFRALYANLVTDQGAAEISG